MSNAIPLTSFDLDELKSRINPAYENIQGTESYERRLCVEEIERLTAELAKHNPIIKTDEQCPHNHKSVGWDEVTCLDCCWIVPSGPTLGPNDGWFPSRDAYKEFKKYKTYPGMETIKPTRKYK
jgi:hypothetical protein